MRAAYLRLAVLRPPPLGIVALRAGKCVATGDDGKRYCDDPRPTRRGLTYPAHKLYKVRGPEKCYLIPAVQDIFIVDIDAEKREIYVKMIEGLETNAD